MAKFRQYRGGVDRYAMDANAFHRACMIRDDQVPLAKVTRLFNKVLEKSKGTRFEVWTRERMAQEMLGRGLHKRAREQAELAIAVDTEDYGAPIARAVLAILDGDES